MQNATSVEKLKCQRYLSRVKPGSFLTEHSHPFQFIGHVASTYVLHHEEEMFLQACATLSTPHTLPNTSLLLISSCTKGPHGTTAEEITKKIRENSFLETRSFDELFHTDREPSRHDEAHNPFLQFANAPTHYIFKLMVNFSINDSLGIWSRLNKLKITLVWKHEYIVVTNGCPEASTNTSFSAMV